MSNAPQYPTRLPVRHSSLVIGLFCILQLKLQHQYSCDLVGQNIRIGTAPIIFVPLLDNPYRTMCFYLHY